MTRNLRYGSHLELQMLSDLSGPTMKPGRSEIVVTLGVAPFTFFPRTDDQQYPTPATPRLGGEDACLVADGTGRLVTGRAGSLGLSVTLPDATTLVGCSLILDIGASRLHSPPLAAHRRETPLHTRHYALRQSC